MLCVFQHLTNKGLFASHEGVSRVLGQSALRCRGLGEQPPWDWGAEWGAGSTSTQKAEEQVLWAAGTSEVSKWLTTPVCPEREGFWDEGPPVLNLGVPGLGHTGELVPQASGSTDWVHLLPKGAAAAEEGTGRGQTGGTLRGPGSRQETQAPSSSSRAASSRPS